MESLHSTMIARNYFLMRFLQAMKTESLSFLSVETDDAMPRIDVCPLTLPEPFKADTSKEEWQSLVTTLLKSYFSTDIQSNVNIAYSDVVVNVTDTGAEMSLSFNCTVKDFESGNMAGLVRLIANTNNAIIVAAMYQGEDGLPGYFTDTYLSAKLD